MSPSENTRPPIRSAYDVHDRVTIDTGTEGGAKQSFKEECDINNILARYAATGLLTPVQQTPGFFVDVSDVGDYREALDNVIQAQALFMQLPAVIRARFENDPAAFLDFASDPTNEDQMREMGLLPPLPAEEPPTPAPEPAAGEQDPPPPSDEGSED